MASQKRCENLGMRQAISLDSYTSAKYAVHLFHTDWLESVSVKHRCLLEMRRVLLSITNIRRVLASSHSSEISGCRRQINWALPTHESKQLLIAHYLSQTYCSVRLLSPSVSFSSVHVACLCYCPFERIPWPCKAGLLYMRINSRLYCTLFLFFILWRSVRSFAFISNTPPVLYIAPVSQML